MDNRHSIDIKPGSLIMIVGSPEIGGLTSSYRDAFEALGFKTQIYNIFAAIDRNCRLGALGRKINNYLPIESWRRKANRDFVAAIVEANPQIVITIGSVPVNAGALAQIKASTQARLAHVWPDTLSNLGIESIQSFQLYNLIATYSKSSVSILQQLCASKIVWLPLACDPVLHPKLICTESEKIELGADITFIGGWRPERAAILELLGNFNLKIWGPEWNRYCEKKSVSLNAWQGRSLRGAEFAKAVASSRINLNIIDPTNYPAANMRFFEIPCAGGLEVCSPCPEMEQEFKQGETIFYYSEGAELPDLLDQLLSDRKLIQKVSAASHETVKNGHTYIHRAKLLLESLSG